jgi:hypothetical protein
MDYRSFAMATEYHVVTLPNKSKVPVRDHFLRDGHTFSATGDVLASGVVFDGTGDVQLDLSIGEKVIQVNNISDDAIAESVDEVSPEDKRLVSAGAVVKGLDNIQPVPEDSIHEIVNPEEPDDPLDFDNEN